MSFVTENFGKRLKFLRETVGLNQSELGDKLGVSRGAISYYENFSRTPDIEILDKVKTFFEVPYEFLLGYSDSMKEEYTDISTIFNLSDVACEELERNPTLGLTISGIIEHDRFLEFLRLYEELCVSYSDFKVQGRGYISYLLTNILNDIIYDVYFSGLREHMSQEDKQYEMERLKASGEQYNKVMEEFKKYEEENDEYIKQIKDDPAYRDYSNQYLSMKSKLSKVTLPIELRNRNRI